MNSAANASDVLAGKHIVVTRAREQAGGWEDLLRQYGAEPIAYPCIAIAPLGDFTELDDCLSNLHDFDWLALSSGNAVRAVAERARELAALPSLKRVRVAALGPVTEAEARVHLGRGADFVPAAFSAEALARELPLGARSRILLPQSDLADERTAAIMRTRGAEVRAVVAYRTVAGSGGADLPAMLAGDKIDALTFASPSAVRFFRQRCRAPAALELPALCVGERTARAAASEGFRRVITPPTFGLRAMIAAYAEYCAQRE